MLFQTDLYETRVATIERDRHISTHSHAQIHRAWHSPTLFLPQGFFWVKCFITQLLEMYENSTKSLCLSLHYKKYCWFNLKNEVTWLP